MAVWIAREFMREPQRARTARLRLICLWAWFSSRPATYGHELIETPWTPDMRIDAARSAAEVWRTVVALHTNLGRLPIADMWLRPGRMADYEFVPLDSIAAITDEAKAMRNCVNTYGQDLARTIGRGSGAYARTASGLRRWRSLDAIAIRCRTSSSSRGQTMSRYRMSCGGWHVSGCTSTICRRSTCNADGERCRSTAKVGCRCGETHIGSPSAASGWLPIAPSREAFDAL